MKAIMYHYVRPPTASLPHFRYLHVEDFRLQLDFFAAHHGFVPREAFLQAVAAGTPPADGVVLTFDDGLAEHAQVVWPELRARGLWGIFYVPVGPYLDGKVLDVHRIHVLLGHAGGTAVLEALRQLVQDSMLSHQHVDDFHRCTYQGQDNDSATDAVKRILNYFISYAWRETVLDRLMTALVPGAPTATSYYATLGQLAAMQADGMLIGSHSVTHRVLARLSLAEQRHEIERSFAFLDDATGGLGVRTFCYPYGGFHSFTGDTERLLGEAGCAFSFNVEKRDVTPEDCRQRPQALPRYDCNAFPHGAAARGEARPGR